MENFQEKLNEQEKLVEKLNYYTKLYDEGHPEISDKEWDDLYFRLKTLEEETHIVLPNSPTIIVSYTISGSQLNKVVHNHQMLSLEKTKSIDEVVNFIGNKDYLGMCKLDGLTCTLRYVNGLLVSAETRGNGIEGEDVTHNAVVIKSIPKKIDYKEELIIDGEVIITYKDFKEFADSYKNPRNFAAGSIRLMDNIECQKRKLTFVAWEVIKGLDEYNKLTDKLDYINKALGFITVPYTIGTKITQDTVDYIQLLAKTMDLPIDGAVFKFNDIEYGKSLGQTSHHFKNALAFKFYDETYESELVDIEWSMGRTGTLTPVAIFNPIDIDGTEVSRANIHNLSVMKQLLGEHPHPGQKVEVFKANMIIPQIYSADKSVPEDLSGEFKIPRVCPVCGGSVEVAADLESESLECVNPACEGKLINQLDHFCGKKGLEIKGLSVATLQRLVDWGWVNEPADIYELRHRADEWSKKSGFGAKSVGNIITAIEDSKNCDLSDFICAIGIPLIGKSASQEIIKHIHSYEDFRDKITNKFDFTQIPSFADSKSSAILNFDYSKADKVYPYLSCELVEPSGEEKTLEGKTIVITGRLVKCKNRAELEQKIKDRGGKVSSSVSGATTVLINNDTTSTSSKNLTAKKLNVPIMSEEDFFKNYLTK